MKASPRHAYGIEVAAGRITVVRAERSRRNKKADVLATAIDPAHDPSWPALAKKMADEQASGLATVAAPMSAHDSFMRPVEAPLSSINKALAVFPSLLDVQLPFPLEQCAWTFTGLKKTTAGHVRAVATAAPREKILGQLELLRHEGIDPEWVTHEALMLWRMAGRQFPLAADALRVLLYLGADRTVAVIGNDREPLAATGMRLAWTSSGNPMRERLVLRLRQFLAGGLRGRSKDSVSYLVAGPGADKNSEYIREACEIAEKQWQVADQSEAFLPLALADAALFPDNWTGNLRNGSLAHMNTARRQSKKTDQLCVAVALASLLLIAGSWFAVHMVSDFHGGLQRDIRAAAISMTGIQGIPRGQEVFLVQRHVEDSTEMYREFQAWLEPSAYPSFLQLVRIAEMRGLAVESMAISSSSLLVRGAGKDWNDPDHLTRPLAQEGWKIDIERNDAGADERIHFVVRAQR